MQFRRVTYAQEIVFESGAIERLGEYVAPYACQRILLCPTGSVQRNGLAARLATALGGRLAATAAPAQAHVPDHEVRAALALAQQCEADSVLGFGGGSALGLAKAVAFALEEQRTGRPTRAAHPTDQPLIPVIAIPTTYAGSEMTPVYGITHTDTDPPRKVTVTDPKIAPKLVVYDPLVTLDLPPEQTGSTGINALAHCVEAIYSTSRNPLASAAALEAVRHIARSLPRCHANGRDEAARSQMLLGAHLAGVALAGAGMALHHGLCHVLGGSAGVAHGIANAIVLPHAMRFNCEATAPLLAPAAEAIGLDTHGLSPEAAALAAADWVSHLVARLGLPQRLRDAGVAEADLPRLAHLALQSRAVRSNPRPVRDEAEVEALLAQMW
jgi:alcohol dehydrogenase class IV